MAEQSTISKNIAHTFIVQIPNYILSLIAGILVTRQLGPEGKGVFTLMTANIQLLVMFLGLNIPGAIQFFMANKKIAPARLSSIALILLLFGGVIVFVSLFLFPFIGNHLLAPNYDDLFFKSYFFISFFMTNFNAMIIGFIQGGFRFRELNHLTLINSILNFVVFASMYYAARYHLIETGLKQVLVLNLSIIGVNVLVTYLFFGKELKTALFKRFSKDDIKKLAVFLVPSYASILVNFFNYRLTIWQVNAYEGTERLGYFSLALNFAQMMLLVTTSINMVLFPYFASKVELKDALKDFSFILKVNGIVMLAATLGLLFFSEFLIPFFYGEVFNPSVPAVKILAVGTFFCSQSQVFGHFFGARNKNWINTFIYSLVLVCIALLGPLLIPVYGIEGAAIASSTSYLLMFILFCIFLRTKFQVSLLSILKITKTDIERVKGILTRLSKKA